MDRNFAGSLFSCSIPKAAGRTSARSGPRSDVLVHLTKANPSSAICDPVLKAWLTLLDKIAEGSCTPRNRQVGRAMLAQAALPSAIGAAALRATVIRPPDQI